MLSLPQEFTYSPGDVAMILPRNNPLIITDFIEKYGLKPNQLIKIEADP